MKSMLEEKMNSYQELLVQDAVSKLRESDERAEDSICDIRKRIKVNLEKLDEYIEMLHEWKGLYPEIAPDWKDMKLIYDDVHKRELYESGKDLRFLDPVKILQEIRNNILMQYQLLCSVESFIKIKQRFYPVLNLDGYVNQHSYLENRLKEYRENIENAEEQFLDMKMRLQDMIDLRNELGVKSYFTNPIDEIDYDRGQRVECISLSEDRVGEVEMDYDYEKGWILMPFVPAR